MRGRGRDERPAGRGRGSRPATVGMYQERSEFEAVDDDDMYSAPQSRPVGKKAKDNKKGDLELNEENYPTF